jgi:predicted nucleic acid binding AN1-type Zn finger protein
MMEDTGKKKQTRCEYCRGKTVFLVQCSRCQKQFCLKDRTPEDHMCSELEQLKKEKIILEGLTPNKIDAI